MRKPLIAVVFLPLIVANTPVPSTATSEYSEKSSRCVDNPDVDAQQCLSNLIVSAEYQLEASFRSSLIVASEEGRAEELKSAQAAWDKFVEAQCKFEVAKFTIFGTGYWSVGYFCYIERTAARIDDLNEVAQR